MVQRKYNWVLSQLTQEQFKHFIFSHLTIPTKGPKPKVIPIEIYKAVLRVVSLVWIIVLVKVKKLKM